MKTIYFTVTNELVYDQRMIRICRSLSGGGFSVVLVGRRRGKAPLRKEPFRQKRLPCLFQTGKLFYLEFNLRLFVFLLFRKMDAICAIDLDTILPCLFISRLKRLTRIYDAHELFSEMKEVITRPRIKKSWDRIERYAVPKFTHGYTVSQSIAEEFKKRYGVDYALIRNLPVREADPPAPGPMPAGINSSDREQTAMPASGEKFILYQGAVNEARGLEALIGAMRQVDCRLMIYGEGNCMETCQKLVKQYGLQDKILFKGLATPAALREITAKATIGINLVEPLGLNQYYSLANKFFDYIHAGIPQVTMDFPEYRRVQDRIAIAVLIADIEEKKIADAINNLLGNAVLYTMLKENCLQARHLYNWQEEEKRLLRFYQHILS